MSVRSDLSPSRAATVAETQARNSAVCETVLSWLHTPPTNALGWDSAKWEEARWSLLVHGIAPLLYRKLRMVPAWAYLTPELRQWMEEQYTLNTERTLLFMEELEAILAAANQAGIMIVPLKGMASLYTVYSEEPGLRPMADMDILVRPADEERFTRLLHDLGYELEESTPRHRSFAHPTARTVASTRGEHPDNPRGVQVHTAVGEQFWGSQYDVTADLWGGSVAAFGAAKGWLSSPEARMTHLLVHGSADVLAGKARLARLVDTARLAEEFDEGMWQTVVAAGIDKGEARWLYTTLALVKKYLDAPIPDGVVAALAKETPRALREFLENTTLYHLSFCNPLRVSLTERLTWHRPGLERITALWHCLFPTPTHLRDYYPERAANEGIIHVYARHLSLMADGFRRSLFRVPRRSWLNRNRGGK